MSLQFKPDQQRLIDQAIRAGLINTASDVVAVGVEILRMRLSASAASSQTARQDAIGRMQEFGDKYRLNLGTPVTRKLLHEEHRY